MNADFFPAFNTKMVQDDTFISLTALIFLLP